MLILLFLTPRMIGWYVYETFYYADRLTMSRAAFVFAVQTWLAQTPEQAKKASTPGYLSAAMACELPYNANPCSSATNVSCGPVLGLGTVRSLLRWERTLSIHADQFQTYLPMFMPPPAARQAAGTEAPPVAPPS